MILSDKSPTRPVPPKPVLSVVPPADPAVAKPVPKALCPSCGRPVALLTAASCLYCGAAQASPAPAKEGASKIPAQMLVMLEPRAHDRKRGKVWLFRAGGILIGIMLVTALIGPCVRGPATP